MVDEYQDPDVREVIEGQYREIYEVTPIESPLRSVFSRSFTGPNCCLPSLRGNQVRNKAADVPTEWWGWTTGRFGRRIDRR